MRLFKYNKDFISNNVLEDLNIIKFLEENLDKEYVKMMTKFLSYNIDIEEIYRRQEFFNELLHNNQLRKYFSGWIKYYRELNRRNEMYTKMDEDIKDIYLFEIWKRYKFVLTQINDDLSQSNYNSKIIKEFHISIKELLADKAFGQINDDIKKCEENLLKNKKRFFKVAYNFRNKNMISVETIDNYEYEDIYSELSELFKRNDIPIREPSRFQYNKSKTYLKYITYLVENDKKMKAIFNKTGSSIKAFLDENYCDLEFDIRIVDMIFIIYNKITENYNMCLPTISDNSFFIKGLYDISIIKKGPIVKNNFLLDDDVYLSIISGVNGGGKTVYARAVGTAVLLAVRGVFVPADNASLPHFESIYTIFNEGENTTSGRFEKEVQEVKDVIEAAGDKSFIIMNELFSTTYSDKAKKMILQVLDECKLKGVKGIYVTHFLEVIEELKNDKSILLLTPEYDVNQQKRTYKIIKAEEAETYIYDILDKYKLKF